jgi:hypothetical protein
MSTLPAICTFWHGEMSWLERVCLASFAEKGHKVDLYTYGEVGPLPKGVRVKDANEIEPEEKVFFYKGSRTPAVFADLFRLRLMQRKAGIWVDCDVYCVKPLRGLGEYVFGIEEGSRLNNAVFRCPANSKLLKHLLEVFEPGAIPPGMPWWRVAEVRLRRALGQALPAENMQFGATGPWPLNHWVRKLGLRGFVQPKAVFYPLDHGAAGGLLKAGSSLEGIVKHETLAVHMWHSALTDRGSGTIGTPEAGSFFASEMARLGVE